MPFTFGQMTQIRHWSVASQIEKLYKGAVKIYGEAPEGPLRG